MLYLLAPLRLGRIAPGFALLLRVVDHASPWGMIEVFMLGIVVSLVKLAHLASVIPGIGLWGFAALMLVSIAAAASYDAHDLWTRYDAIPIAHARALEALSRDIAAAIRQLEAAPK